LQQLPRVEQSIFARIPWGQSRREYIGAALFSVACVAKCKTLAWPASALARSSLGLQLILLIR
jgi:hypothetical protein